VTLKIGNDYKKKKLKLVGKEKGEEEEGDL
jgi:hypothetical protein